jgi:hypothetical protein
MPRRTIRLGHSMSITGLTTSVAWQWGAGLLLVAMGCGSPAEAPGAKVEKASALQPQLSCIVTRAENGGVEIIYEIRNETLKAIYLVANGRVPYQRARGPNTLVIFHGVHFAIDNVYPTVVESPLLGAIAPGATIRGSVSWPKRALFDHYRGRLAPPSLLHGVIRIYCDVGWWTVPFNQGTEWDTPLDVLVDSQQLLEAGPIEVELP